MQPVKNVITCRAVSTNADTLFCVLTKEHATSCTDFLRLSLDESNLIIANVNRGDEGNYTCVIKTELEQKSVSARLMVMGMTCILKKQ